VNAKTRPSRSKAKESLGKLLAAGAGTALVASMVAAPAPADAAARGDSAPVLERARELRSRLSQAPAIDPAQAPVQLAWWGNWHNWGYHPYWHNWPNWRNWHNWPNWGNYL
jgi:hypothetical protein